MTREHLISLIRGKSVFHKEDIGNLKDLVNRYPYSSTFRILYLKALKEHDDIHYTEKLRNFTFRTPDRKKLYDLLYRSSSEKPHLQKTLPAISTPEEEEKPLPHPSQEEASDIPLEKAHPQSEEDSSASYPAPPEKSGENDPESDARPDPERTLEKEIMVSAVQQQLYKEIEADLEETREKKGEKGKDKTETSPEKKEREEMPSTPSSRPRFSDWLTPSEEGDRATAGLQETKAENPLSKDQEDLEAIRDFVTSERSKKQDKVDFFSPSEMARKSTEEDPTLVSETLAEIHVQQGHYQKAVEAFEALKSKFPGKSDYFAERIDKIRSEIRK